MYPEKYSSLNIRMRFRNKRGIPYFILTEYDRKIHILGIGNILILKEDGF